MYDLIIKGGRLIDPAQNIDYNQDIAIIGTKIAEIAKDIPSQKSARSIDARNKIVTPGLIDLHCHVYPVVSATGAEPDEAGVNQGVTTVVDAGTAGQATFGGFPRYVISSARTRVYAFLYLGSVGLCLVPPLRDWDEINESKIEMAITNNRDIIKGIKLGLSGKLVTAAGLKVLEIAKKITRKVELPLMIHIGDSDRQVTQDLTRQCLTLLERGDILSHVFTGDPVGILRQDGTVLSELIEARDRGVVLDIANGSSNMSFEVARKAMNQGILPTTLSTDVSSHEINGPTYGMTVTMSKFLALGLDIIQIVRMSTINPAIALHIENTIGSLKPGMEADISILEILTGFWEFPDSEKEKLKMTKLIKPSLTIKAGKIIPCNLSVPSIN